MKKEVTVSHDDGPMEEMDMVQGILTNLGVEYTTTEGDEGVTIQYTVPPSPYSERIERIIYEKWEKIGFLEGVEVSHRRLMSEVFEEACYTLLSYKFSTLLAQDGFTSNIVEVMIFPILRRIYEDLMVTGDEGKLDVPITVEELVRTILANKGKLDGTEETNPNVDYEASLAVAFSTATAKMFKDGIPKEV